MAMKDKLWVLVVDDMATSRGLITQALDSIGIKHYDWEPDGQAAMRYLSKTPCHLVISDYNMPNMDGLQLLHAIRSDKTTNHIGFILVTGTKDASLVNRGKQLGMNNYIPKPFTQDGLRKCIEAVTGPLD